MDPYSIFLKIPLSDLYHISTDMTLTSAYLDFTCYISVEDLGKVQVISKGTPNDSLGNSTLTVLGFLCIFKCFGSICRGSHILYLLLPKFQTGFMMILHPFDIFITAERPCNYVSHSLMWSSTSFGKTFVMESSVVLI